MVEPIIELEAGAPRQRLSPQQLVVAAKGPAVTVRVPSPGVRTHFETPIDDRLPHHDTGTPVRRRAG